MKKSGSWYSYEGERIGQGRESVKAFLEDNPDLMNKIRDQLMDLLKPNQEDNDSDSPAPDVPDVTDSEGSVEVDEDGVIIE